MDASKASFRVTAFRPLSVVAAAAVLVTGVACGGARDRIAVRHQSTSTPVTTAVAGTPTTVAAAPSPAPSVRTDDLEADLQQADSQLAQTASAVADADQNTQQLDD